MKAKLISIGSGVITFLILFKIASYFSSALWNGGIQLVDVVLGIIVIIGILIASVAISQKVYGSLKSIYSKQ